MVVQVVKAAAPIAKKVIKKVLERHELRRSANNQIGESCLMLQPRSIHSSLSFKDKIFSIDYILVFSIFILGLVSILAMYSTDGGEFKYHTNSHILRFFVFFGMFLFISFIQIRFWHSQSYLIYILFFFLLLGVKYFGLNIIRFKKMVRFIFYEFTTI